MNNNNNKIIFNKKMDRIVVKKEISIKFKNKIELLHKIQKTVMLGKNSV